MSALKHSKKDRVVKMELVMREDGRSDLRAFWRSNDQDMVFHVRGEDDLAVLREMMFTLPRELNLHSVDPEGGWV